MNDTAELMQTTVPLTWNKPEWMLPEGQEPFDVFLMVDVLICCYGKVEEGRFSLETQTFCHKDGDDIQTEDVGFWAYMPKHPNK